MGRQQYDSLDRKILEMLTENARVPFLEIARSAMFRERLYISVFRNSQLQV